ncbi:hypothetical protein BDZ45DRAFT_633090 [Acephala macrosclerotiorum]|nr:hypothetical protein BDZ45DRAFT_633090 [Acephala macrosclerotiorum]
MALQATEIVYITLKPGIELEGTSASAQAWADIIATLQRQDGYQRLYYGRTVENPNLLIMMIDWDSVDAHNKFMSLPEYTPFAQRLGLIIEGIHLHHFLPTPSPPSVLGTAPVIEFATFYDAAPDFKASLEKFIKVMDNPEGTAGHAYGEIIEEVSKHADGEEGKKGKAVVLTIGWESVDTHMKFRETEKFKSNIGLIRGNHGGVEMFHVAFKAV